MLVSALSLAFMPFKANAETWPTKTLTAIVPFAAGSFTDVVPRVVFEQLSKQLGQSIIVENRPGAGTTTGAALVAKSDPDGYTILVNSSAHTNPLQIVQVKGLVAGPFLLALGLLAGDTLPAPTIAAVAGMVGFLGYGVSLALFVLALRQLGAARTGAYFSTAPFLSAFAAILFLREPLTFQLLAAGLLMGAGVWLHLTEHHEHEHEHGPMEHTHAHVQTNTISTSTCRTIHPMSPTATRIDILD